MKEIKVGFFGLGTVASQVLKQMTKQNEYFKSNFGFTFVPYKACVRNINKSRDLATQIEMSDDPNFILLDDEVDMYLELMGGIDLAKKVILSGFSKNIPVITANKMLLAETGEEIFRMFKNSNSYLGFEAAVCGGIPIINSINDSYSGDNIVNILGILNGTSNFFLSSMRHSNIEFEQALNKAWELGYAEEDPSLDIGGFDAAHKLILLMNLSFKKIFKYNELSISGIEDITLQDIEYINELGYEIKLLGKATKMGNDVEAFVRPGLVSQNHPFAKVDGSLNAVMLESEFALQNHFLGHGAGGKPTANSVVSDMIDSIFLGDQTSNSKYKNFVSVAYEGQLVSPDHEYYISMRIKDELGALNKTTKILENNGVSVSKLIQKDLVYQEQKIADLNIITHKTNENKILKIMEDIRKMDITLSPGKFYIIL